MSPAISAPMPGDKLLRARWIVTGVADRVAEVIEDGAILHRDGAIVAVGPAADIVARAPHAPVTHHAGQMVLPGFVNGHHHLGLTPLQLGAPDDPLELWFATRIAMRGIDIRLDTLFSAFEMIASGTTTVQHIQGWMSGDLDTVVASARGVIGAYREIGMRCSYSFGAREQNHFVLEGNDAFCARLPAALGERLRPYLESQSIPLHEHLALFDTLLQENAGQALTRVQIAPANLHWMTDDGLLAMFERARGAGVTVHMHLMETPFQKEYALRRTGVTAIRHLHRLGVLGPHLTLGHGVWMNEEDIDIAAEAGVCVCTNCSSNFRLRSGVAPLNEWRRRGMRVAIGCDEAGINEDRDMLQEMRMVLTTHRTPGLGDDVPTAADVLRMATEHGASSTPFGAHVGRLVPGMRLDATVLDWKAATYPYQDPLIDPVTAMIQRAKANAVVAVLVDGAPIYESGRFLRVDRDAVLAEIAEALGGPRSPAEQELAGLSRDVYPHVRRFYEAFGLPPGRTPFYAPSSRT